jgi:hypothetical protein
MNCILNICPAHRDKFNEVVQIMNHRRGTNIQILAEDGWQLEIEFEQPQHLFLLGRMFEPYKPAVRAGSMTYEQNNDYLNNI